MVKVTRNVLLIYKGSGLFLLGILGDIIFCGLWPFPSILVSSTLFIISLLPLIYSS